MLKFEQIVFGNISRDNKSEFTLTMFDEVTMKYSAIIIIEGTTIEPQRWYIRSDNLHELYHESRRIGREFMKQNAVDVVLLMFGFKIHFNDWKYYRPLVLHK